MTLCPICLEEPAVVLATTVSPCETCYQEAKELDKPGDLPEDPTGLIGHQFTNWLIEHSDVKVDFCLHAPGDPTFIEAYGTALFANVDWCIHYTLDGDATKIISVLDFINKWPRWTKRCLGKAGE